MKSASYNVRTAVATLFQGFRSSKSVETAWARRLMRTAEVSDETIVLEIHNAIALYCPNLPDEYVPFVTELLTAGIRLARREEGLEAAQEPAPMGA